MSFDRYQLLIIGLGIPLTVLLLFAEPLGISLRVQITVVLVWLGVGFTLLNLSMTRRIRLS